MSKPKKKKHEIAFGMYLESGGKISNTHIAKELNVNPNTVRKWKSRYKWTQRLNGEAYSDITKSVTKNKNVTGQKPSVREVQKKRIIDSLEKAGAYSLAYEPLIDIYLDAYEEYQYVKEKGGETDKLRKELAKYLGQLGLDGKNKDLIKKPKEKIEKEKNEGDSSQNNKLIQFRQRMTK